MKLKECTQSKHHGAYPADEDCPWCEKPSALQLDWLQSQESPCVQRRYRNVVVSDGTLSRCYVFGEDEG